MNKSCQAILIILLLFVTNAWSQTVQADFDYAVFFNNKSGSYLETYLSFNGDSLHYIMNDDSALVALVEVTMLFKNADKIKEYRKFKIPAGPLPDTTSNFEDLINKQKISMPNGVYNFDIIIKDLYGADTVTPFRKKDLITIDIPTNEMVLGGVELLDNYEISRNKNIFMKGEYECIPHVSDIYTEDDNYLKVYTELYNAAKTLGPLETFFYLFHIEEVNTSKPIKGYSYFQKDKAYNFNSVYKELQIKNLPKGNYFLKVEIQDSLNRIVLSTEKYFRKIGAEQEGKLADLSKIIVTNTFVEMLNPEKLTDYIKMLKPISDADDKMFIDSILDNADINTKKQFFIHFWNARNESDSKTAWLEYKQVLDTVQVRFGSDYQEGYETDRGKVMLVYGMPNEIVQSNKLVEKTNCNIWHYYKLKDQADVVFAFDKDNDKRHKLLFTNLKWVKVEHQENCEGINASDNTEVNKVFIEQKTDD